MSFKVASLKIHDRKAETFCHITAERVNIFDIGLNLLKADCFLKKNFYLFFLLQEN